MKIVLGRKQAGHNDMFTRVYQNIQSYISKDEVDALIEQSVKEIVAMHRLYPNMAYGWSGGKDSIALQIVCEIAGIKPCVFAIIKPMEWPEYLEWCYVNAPGGDPRNGSSDLSVWDNPTLTIGWLTRNQRYLFPKNRVDGYWWVKKRTHHGQSAYYLENELDCILYGRRVVDGNIIGPNGLHVNKAGIRQFCPIRDWPHEAVLGAIHYYGRTLPPTYSWPRGWTVGTGLWAGRTGFTSPEEGWKFTHSIDPVLVETVGPRFQSGRNFLSTL